MSVAVWHILMPWHNFRFRSRLNANVATRGIDAMMHYFFGADKVICAALVECL